MQVPLAKPTIATSGLPGARQTATYNPVPVNTNTDSFAAIDAMKNAVNVGEQVVGAYQQAHEQELKKANELRALDAVNQYQANHQDAEFAPGGWLSVNGENVFKQDNNKPFTDNVLEGLNKSRRLLEESLSNDDQKMLFKQHADRLDLQTRGRVAQHEAQQYRVFASGSLQAGQNVEAKNIISNFNDIEGMKLSVEKIKKYGSDLGALHGDGADIGRIKGDGVASAAINNAVVAALDVNDRASAAKILKEMSPHMDQADILKAYKLLDKHTTERTAISVVDDVYNEMRPKLNPNESDRFLDITWQAESSGRQFGSDGKTITSPAGAIGKAQVMLATGPEAAKLAGLPWDENRLRTDEEYNVALGTAYLNKQLVDNHGDIKKAWAAYNAGPGALEKAIAEATKNGDPEKWLQELPVETQQYVTSNYRKYTQDDGPKTRATLEDFEKSVLDRLGPDVDPEARKIALSEANRRFKVQEYAYKQRSDESRGQAFQMLRDNGGDYAALPASIRNKMTTDDYVRVTEYAKKMSKREPIQTDYTLYYALLQDKAALDAIDLNAVADKFAPGEMKDLIRMKQDPGHETNTRSVKQVLDTYMKAAGINPNTKDQDEAARVGKVWSFFNEKLAAAKETAGRNLNDQEISKLASDVFTKTPVKYLRYFSKDKLVVDLEPGDEIQVPEEHRAAIVKAWSTKNPGVPMKEIDIVDAYYRKLGLKRGS